MIVELYEMFGDYDKLEKCDAMLYDSLFGIGVSKKNGNETFDEFYARFSAIIASLRYSEIHKSFVLRRLITYKLRMRVAGISSSSFRLFVEHLRKVDQDLRQLKAFEDMKVIDENKFRLGLQNYSEQFKT